MRLFCAHLIMVILSLDIALSCDNRFDKIIVWLVGSAMCFFDGSTFVYSNFFVVFCCRYVSYHYNTHNVFVRK